MSGQIEQVAAVRSQLWAAGFRPIPVYTFDHPHKDAGKAPLGDGWADRARQNPPECTTLPPVKHALNTGILCDGLRPIDLDIEDPKLASRCLGVIVGRFGEAPIRTRRNSSRCLVLYRAAVGEPHKVTITGNAHVSKVHSRKIEVLGKGQQFVAYGKHPSGADLEWFPEAPSEESLGSLPAITEDELFEALAECAAIIDAPAPVRSNGHDHEASVDPQADPLRIAAALNAIPNAGPADWESWNRVAMAVWRATGGSDAGWIALDAWSRRNPSYDATATRERWDHYFISPPTRIGAPTIFYMASQARQEDRAQAEEPPPHVPNDNIDEGARGGKYDDSSNERSRPDYECTLSDLKGRKFKPIMWIVPNYIPEGLTVFAGKPKIGKSWLMLGVGLGVSRGKEALNEFVQKGDVLYLGLEDGERRMQSRVIKILGPAAANDWPENFTFRWRLDALDAGGLDYIEKWLIEHPDRRLVVIDTLGKVRGKKARDEEQYQYDYRMMGGLQEMATKYRVAIVVVHHVRKSDAEDVLDTISGTTGIAGAADNAMVLGITDKGARLYIRGRDCEEQDKLVEFDHETALWDVAGDFDEANPGGGLQGLRKRVYDLLASALSPMTPAQITEKLNDPAAAPRAKVKLTLWRMLNSEPPQVAKSAAVFGAETGMRMPGSCRNCSHGACRTRDGLHGQIQLSACTARGSAATRCYDAIC